MSRHITVIDPLGLGRLALGHVCTECTDALMPDELGVDYVGRHRADMADRSAPRDCACMPQLSHSIAAVAQLDELGSGPAACGDFAAFHPFRVMHAERLDVDVFGAAQMQCRRTYTPQHAAQNGVQA